jgi:hypothetical protein
MLHATRLNRARKLIFDDPEEIEKARKIFKIFNENRYMETVLEIK